MSQQLLVSSSTSLDQGVQIQNLSFVGTRLAVFPPSDTFSPHRTLLSFNSHVLWMWMNFLHGQTRAQFHGQGSRAGWLGGRGRSLRLLLVHLSVSLSLSVIPPLPPQLPQELQAIFSWGGAAQGSIHSRTLGTRWLHLLFWPQT